MYDVVAIGECLIDFVPAGANDTGMPLYSQNPGGAPANVLAMNARFGRRTAFIGKVGRDSFGYFLQEFLEKAGIDCSGLCRDENVHTTLAFVHLDKSGNRSFAFYRNPGADLMLRTEDIKQELLENCRIFHYGSVSLTAEPCRSTIYNAITVAKKAGALISYDPNYRPLLWKDKKSACREMLKAMEFADILKVSDEEMTLLTEETDLASGAEKLKARGPLAVFVTCGPDGAYLSTPAGSEKIPTCKVNALDTTGAGDAFWGALLSRIPGRGRKTLETLSLEDWRKAVRLANAAGSLTTTGKGAIPSMPNLEALKKCLENME